jgi:NodT family efflux transporter outer membrane factor (OMF) lipoprotein
MLQHARVKEWFFLCLLTGCTVSMPEEERVAHILPAPSIDSSIAQALQNRFFTEDQWPSKKWWTAYGSQELNALIEIALGNNPTIEGVQQRVQYAKSRATIARSKLLPLLYFNASDDWEYLSKSGLYRALNPDIKINPNLIDFSLSFSYEFDFWGKYRNLYHSAQSMEKAAVAETAQADLITTTALAQAYFALKTNLVRRDLYKQLYWVRKDTFDLQLQLLSNAIYSKLPPLLSEEKVFEAEQWLFDIEQEIEVGKHVVNALAGRGPDEPLALDEPLAELPKQLAVPSEISTELLARRPDLMAQIWRVDALAYEVGAAKADFFPNVNLSAFAGWESTSWSKIFEWGTKMLGLIPGLNLPIYTAGAIGANVSAKKALFLEAVYAYNDLILNSFEQVTNLFSIGRAIYEKKASQMQLVNSAKERYELAELLQRQGIESALFSYQLQEEFLQTELDNIRLLYEQYRVSINLTKALGGGYLYE